LGKPAVVSSSIKALGEVNLRASNLAKMTRFYVDVLGLKPIFESEKHVFLKVAEGYEGHPQVVALFNHKEGGDGGKPNVRKTTLHHIAFSISLEDFAKEKKRLRGLGLKINEEHHREPHWRSMYFNDPDGNQVELVCYDSSVV
jgi:catechol-2,3-dioxygenase